MKGIWLKWIGIGVIVILVIAAGTGYYFYRKFAGRMIKLTPEYLAKVHQTVAEQNEDAIIKPKPRKRLIQAKNALKNVYFGDTHVHTALSFDSYLFGNRIGLEEAYQFAQGKMIKNVAGEAMQLTVPHDFVAITDHAESFGLFEGCATPGITQEQKEFCAEFDNPSALFFWGLRTDGQKRPPKRPAAFCGEDGKFCFEHSKTTWETVVKSADKHNQPGVFTAFAAYEYSPPLPGTGKAHRNVIFRNSNVPEVAVSAYEALSVVNLWQQLEESCTGDCEFLTIPHNMNKMWGIAYSGKTIDGDPYSTEDWRSRGRNEPLAEIFQIKGASECAMGAGAVDEECNFEQTIPLCNEDEPNFCIDMTSMAREGLKIGLELEEKLGFNPLKFGFVGSTDTHNGNPGDTEEWDYRGVAGVYTATAKRRLAPNQKGFNSPLNRNPGGLAAIWAVENTRDALFDAMKNKETYATSGTRIKLRFFGGWDFADSDLKADLLVKNGYQKGVPMGGTLNTGSGKPAFMVWAMKDPDSANLQRIQMVKGWYENGEKKETVIDIACSDGLTPDKTTGRCPDNGARVDVSTCQITPEKGQSELKVRWIDKEFNPAHSSFYYVRVLENPTCRWSTYDAIRLGQKPYKGFPATIRERAWSSPIWVKGRGRLKN